MKVFLRPSILQTDCNKYLLEDNFGFTGSGSALLVKRRGMDQKYVFFFINPVPVSVVGLRYRFLPVSWPDIGTGFGRFANRIGTGSGFGWLVDRIPVNSGQMSATANSSSLITYRHRYMLGVQLEIKKCNY